MRDHTRRHGEACQRAHIETDRIDQAVKQRVKANPYQGHESQSEAFCLRPVADMANHEPVEDVHDAIADEETPERAATGQALRERGVRKKPRSARLRRS